MMRNIKFYLLFILVLSVLNSCIKPPEGTEKINAIAFMKDVLDKINSFKDDENKRNEYIGNLMKNLHSVLVLQKDSTINVNSKEAKPGADDIGYSLSNNKFKLIKPVYITFEKKDLAFSFDNITWYSSKSDASKKIEAIYQNINYTTTINNNKLFIEYDATFKLGRNPTRIKITEGKNILTLTGGMVLSSPDMKEITDNLDKSILFIPANSVISANMNLDGNIMQSYMINGSMVFKSMTDIFLYYKKNMFSISFDQINWDSNIFAFDINSLIEVKVNEGNQINFNISVSANYDNNKISLSILKLLLSMGKP
jgi:hypothetical protein